MATLPMLVCLVSHGSGPSYAPVPALAHIPERIRGDAESLNSFDDGAKPPGSMLFGNATQEPPQVKMHAYPAHSAYFVIPSAGPGAYSPTDAALAHSRSLMFLRRYLGGPHFDLEEIWDEHTHWEFVDRSVAKTMSTMVVG
jgi:carboxymethylenebutenolidase